MQCKDASGIHDTSLLLNMECDADIRKNSYANFMPLGGTAMFQGTVERVTKEPTALAPSTMNFPVAATRVKVFAMDWNIHLVFPWHISACLDVYHLFFLPCRRTLSSRRRGRCSAV